MPYVAIYDIRDETWDYRFCDEELLKLRYNKHYHSFCNLKELFHFVRGEIEKGNGCFIRDLDDAKWQLRQV